VLTAEVASRLCLVLPESLFKRVYLSVLDADDEGAAGAAGIACAKGHDGVVAMNALQRGFYLKMQVETLELKAAYTGSLRSRTL
jgi:hypothetical protein